MKYRSSRKRLLFSFYHTFAALTRGGCIFFKRIFRKKNACATICVQTFSPTHKNAERKTSSAPHSRGSSLRVGSVLPFAAYLVPGNEQVQPQREGARKEHRIDRAKKPDPPIVRIPCRAHARRDLIGIVRVVEVARVFVRGNVRVEVVLRRELRAAKVWIWTFAITTLFLSSYIIYNFARQCYPEAF